MKKLLSISLLIALSGCATTTAEKIDVKNSPCACNYEGRQLVEPSPAQKLAIIEELKGIV